MDNDRWEGVAALSGVALAVLFIALIALAGDLPKAPAPGREVSSYFALHRSALLAAGYLEGLVAVAMVWFWGVLRSALARREGGTARLANVVLAAGAGQAILYILNSAFWGVLAYMSIRPVDPATAEILYRVGSAAFAVGAFPFAAALLAMAVGGLRHRALPAWLAWITGALGVIALILRAIPEETFGPERVGSVAFFIVPVWFAVVGLVLARRRTAGTEAVGVGPRLTSRIETPHVLSPSYPAHRSGQTTGGGVTLHLRGTVLPDGVLRDVFIRDGRITFDEQADAETVFDGGYLVPGLVDAHAHLSLFSPAGDSATADDRVRESARKQLEAGVLAIREPGSRDRASIGLGPAAGLPRTFTGGRLLAPAGRYFPGLAREVTEDELPAAAEDEARASGAWAKVIGDFPEAGGRLIANFRPETLAEAARRVHGAGARITIHAALPEVIEAAIEGGFDSIEHAIMLRDEHIGPMVRGGVALVPTLIIREGILESLTDLGAAPDAFEFVRQALDGQPEMVRRASDGGVTVLAGTDAGMGPHGQIAVEVENLLRAGLGAEAALGAASWSARSYLGLPGIEEGAPADIVAYRDDPRGDPEVLRRPAVIVLDGRVVLPR